MSTPRRRRHSAAVYRRRRIVLLAVLVLIVLGVWLAFAQPWRAPSDPSAQRPADPIVPAVTSSATAEASGTPSDDMTLTDAEAAKAKPCDAKNIVVEPHTDKRTYAPDQRPELTVTLRNAGPAPCKINVGTTEQVFTVTSGDDTWWRSTDCQSQPSDMVVALAVGQKVSSSQPVVWDRSRSSVATCQADDRPAAPGDGATYHLSVSVGGVASKDAVSFMLQ